MSSDGAVSTTLPSWKRSLSKRLPVEHRGISIKNTEKCWAYLNEAAKTARILGYVPLDKVRDEKNDQRTITEYGEHVTTTDLALQLYSLEIDNSGRSNQYRFDVTDDAGTPTGLGRF